MAGESVVLNIKQSIPVLMNAIVAASENIVDNDKRFNVIAKAEWF